MMKKMALKAAFIFLAPEVDPQKDRQTVVTPQVELADDLAKLKEPLADLKPQYFTLEYGFAGS